MANEGETYYRYGVMLKKVANFYNNMASQASRRRFNSVESVEVVVKIEDITTSISAY